MNIFNSVSMQIFLTFSAWDDSCV